MSFGIMGKAVDPMRQRMAAALRGGAGMGVGGLSGGGSVQPGRPPSGMRLGRPVTTGNMGSGVMIDQGMGTGGGGGGGGWQQMPLGMAFTSLLDAMGSAKGGTPLPRGSGSFMIGPDARQYIPGYKPGQVQAVYKPNTFNLGGKKKVVE